MSLTNYIGSPGPQLSAGGWVSMVTHPLLKRNTGDKAEAGAGQLWGEGLAAQGCAGSS